MQPWEVHPALVHFPVAFIVTVMALDVHAWWKGRPILWSRPAATLLAAGVLTGLVAAAAGWLAFFTVPAHTHDAHGLMYWHFSTLIAALAILAVPALRRWRTRDLPPTPALRALTLAGGLLLVGGSYLGGEIVYKGGAGVDPAILAPEVRKAHVHQ